MKPRSLLTMPFGWPLASFILLTIVCLILPGSQTTAIQQAGQFFSTKLYQTLIVISVLLLLFYVFIASLVPAQVLQTPSEVKRKRIVWWPILISLFSFLCVSGLKLLTQLPRPNGEHTGFPSGHTTFAFALSWLVAQTYPRLAPLWFAAAVGIGWSRVEVGAHFVYQVLIGAILGTTLGWWISHKSKWRLS